MLRAISGPSSTIAMAENETIVINENIVVTVVAMSYAVIAGEERYLEREFGGEYTNFKASVPRWL